MTEHMRKMSMITRDLNAAGNRFTEEQQVQTVLCSLAKSWDAEKLTMMQRRILLYCLELEEE